MKITSIETLCLSRPHEPENQWITSTARSVKADCAIVVIHTDGDHHGIGEACAYGVPPLIREQMEWFSHELVGCDPEDPAIVPHPNGSNRTYDAAVGGVDSALWDLRGKASGKTVSQLLAEKPLERVRLYASSGCRYDWRERPEQLIDEALEYIADGFTAFKFRIGTHWDWDGVTPDRFLQLIEKLVAEVDGRMELILEGNMRLSEADALVIAAEIDRLGFIWFEEPIPASEIDGYARLNASVNMPISGGEGSTTLERFQPYLEKKAYSVVQPDAGLCGISECLRIGRTAHRWGVDLVPHNWHNGLMTMANAHLVAALPNPRFCELCMIQGPLQWEILKEKPVIRDGYLELPDRPGLGVELADDLEDRFPYIEGSYAVTDQR
ncbi:MAG: mandelate racemase/muconate lactonizing enzyme family protein [Planctomycetota bacterium]|jgi:L-alanine-DL-glutamate epimerase-like enolase superfamily enzyme|nr:mandelate racemase/muconate lactonizing enzyme family protein [Planctomycetota bacterium]